MRLVDILQKVSWIFSQQPCVQTTFEVCCLFKSLELSYGCCTSEDPEMHGCRSRTVEHSAFAAEDGISPSRFLGMSASVDDMVSPAGLEKKQKTRKKFNFQVNC